MVSFGLKMGGGLLPLILQNVPMVLKHKIYLNFISINDVKIVVFKFEVVYYMQVPECRHIYKKDSLQI